MTRYIDADRLINDVSGNAGVFVFGPKTVMDIVSTINSQPTADVNEIKHGYWKYSKEENIVICSNCGYEHYIGEYHQYATNGCPKCLTKMDERSEIN